LSRDKNREHHADSLQISRYFPGIGVGVSPFEKVNDGILGQSCEKLIDEVYDVRNIF
jgi:hypothetical protein